MASVVESVVIRAPCEEVFDYRLRFENLPEYNPDVVSMRCAAEPGEGARYRFRVRLRPFGTVACTLIVESVERPRRIEIVLRSLLPAREVTTFEPTGDGTRVELDMRVPTPGGPLAPVLDRLFVVPNARRQMAAELARMKRVLEGRSR